MSLKNVLMGAAIAALGVAIAGYAMKWGHENDVPFLKDAHDGFDS